MYWIFFSHIIYLTRHKYNLMFNGANYIWRLKILKQIFYPRCRLRAEIKSILKLGCIFQSLFCSLMVVWCSSNGHEYAACMDLFCWATMSWAGKGACSSRVLKVLCGGQLLVMVRCCCSLVFKWPMVCAAEPRYHWRPRVLRSWWIRVGCSCWFQNLCLRFKRVLVVLLGVDGGERD